MVRYVSSLEGIVFHAFFWWLISPKGSVGPVRFVLLSAPIMVLLGGKLSEGLKEKKPSTSLEHKWFVKELLITFRCELFVSTRVLYIYIYIHIYLLYKKQMCIKEIEGFKVSKMHWVLYSSENPDTFSFHILTCWVDLSAPLKELQGDGLSFAPRNMSWHVPCLHLFQIHLEEQWNWLVWKCLGDPPFLFFWGRGQLNAWIFCLL